MIVDVGARIEVCVTETANVVYIESFVESSVVEIDRLAELR